MNSPEHQQLETSGLRANLTPGAQITALDATGRRLQIPAGPGGRYRLAQLDDYHGLARRRFPHRSGLRISLQARASNDTLAGTWGFGLWNNPFGMALTSGLERLSLPTLPNAAWFFFASEQNYLALRDDLPAQGWTASVFKSPNLPAAVLTPAALALPLLLVPPAVRSLRRLAGRIVRQEAVSLAVRPSEWHTYGLAWEHGRVHFEVDGQPVLVTTISPRGPLGLVIWIDNQYAALTPQGRVRYGVLETLEPAWIEIRRLAIQAGQGWEDVT